MSSAQKSFAQINARGKYFIVIDTALAYYPTSFDSVQLDSAVRNTDDGNVSGLLKDLGREIVTYDVLGANAIKMAVYRQVQEVSGAGSEGVSSSFASDTAVYVKVWDAAGEGVGVARTG